MSNPADIVLIYTDQDGGLREQPLTQNAAEQVVQARKEYVASRPSAEDVSQILALAPQRVGDRFELVSHGEVGEPSNGALILKLAELASGRLGVQPAVPAPTPDPALGLDQKALSALMEFAERGYTRELGAIDVRHHYTEAELAGMNERFESVRRALDTLRQFKSSDEALIYHAPELALPHQPPSATPVAQEGAVMSNPTDIVLVYKAVDGKEWEQPLSDIVECGTLIDPDDGSDLELVGWRFPEGQDYILVDGGLVQNDPALPVFDLDVLDSDDFDQATVSEVVDLYDRIAAHPAASADWPSALERAADIVREHGAPEQAGLIDQREAARLAALAEES